MRGFAERSRASEGTGALLACRLEPEKGIGVAIEACRRAGIALVVAGEGSERARFDGSAGVTFVGRVDEAELARLRERARIALMPSLTSETFGLAAAEAMAAGLPVAGSAIGALPELVPGEWLAPAGDAGALAQTITAIAADAGAGERALAHARSVLDPVAIGAALASIYEPTP